MNIAGKVAQIKLNVRMDRDAGADPTLTERRLTTDVQLLLNDLSDELQERVAGWVVLQAKDAALACGVADLISSLFADYRSQL